MNKGVAVPEFSYRNYMKRKSERLLALLPVLEVNVQTE